jgi:hypothetical protein
MNAIARSCLSGFVMVFAMHSFGGTARAQSGYSVVKVDDGGTISGRVTWTGPTPKVLRLPATKNRDICDPDNLKTLDLERMVIGGDGGVANTVVYLRNVTRGKAFDLPPARQHLDQKNCRYAPHITLLAQGSDLLVTSSDPILHTVHMAGAAANNVPFPMQNVTIPVRVRQDGVIDLKCNAGHVWMNAEVVVVKHPYYTVSDVDGSFKLTGVPGGEYEIEAWHEGWRIEREESVLDVGAQVQVHRPIYSEPKTWTKKVTVKPGETSTVNFSLSE